MRTGCLRCLQFCTYVLGRFEIYYKPREESRLLRRLFLLAREWNLPESLVTGNSGSLWMRQYLKSRSTSIGLRMCSLDSLLHRSCLQFSPFKREDRIIKSFSLHNFFSFHIQLPKTISIKQPWIFGNQTSHWKPKLKRKMYLINLFR